MKLFVLFILFMFSDSIWSISVKSVNIDFNWFYNKVNYNLIPYKCLTPYIQNHVSLSLLQNILICNKARVHVYSHTTSACVLTAAIVIRYAYFHIHNMWLGVTGLNGQNGIKFHVTMWRVYVILLWWKSMCMFFVHYNHYGNALALRIYHPTLLMWFFELVQRVGSLWDWLQGN